MLNSKFHRWRHSPTAIGLLLLLVLFSGCPKQNGTTTQPLDQQPAKRVKKRWTLTPSPQVLVRGKTLTLSLRNEGSQTYSYPFRGGTNSCVLPIFRIQLVHESGQVWSPINLSPSRRCYARKVPPSMLTLSANQSILLKVYTNKVMYLYNPRTRKTLARPLPLGRYTVRVRGGRLNVRSRKNVLLLRN